MMPEPGDIGGGGPEPDYTMTMNQRMTMNYEPPPLLASPRPSADFADETVRHRAVNVVSSGRSSRHEVMPVDGRYYAETKATTKQTKKKQKKVSGSGVGKNRLPRSRDAPDVDDDDAATRKKKPVSRPPPPPPAATATRKMPEPPRTVSSGTQMAVDKSTQMQAPQPTTDSDDDDDEVGRKKRGPASAPRRKTPEPRMVDSGTHMSFDKSTQMAPARSDHSSDDDDGTTRKKRAARYVVGAARVVCAAAGSTKRPDVRPSVCLSRQTAAAATSGWFAAELGRVQQISIDNCRRRVPRVASCLEPRYEAQHRVAYILIQLLAAGI